MEPCVEYPGHRTADGYGRYWRGGRRQLAHRWAWEDAYGAIPPGMFVLHHCDNPPCVNVTHLYLGTKLDNAQDRDTRRRRNALRGEAHPFARLTEAQVREIRARRATGESYTAIARATGIPRGTLPDIVKRRHWRHVT